VMFPFDGASIVGLTAELDRWASRLDCPIASRRCPRAPRRVLHAEAIAAWIAMGHGTGSDTDPLHVPRGDRGEDLTARDPALLRGYRDAMRYAHHRAAEDSLD
jgi:hypothetical protein